MGEQLLLFEEAKEESLVREYHNIKEQLEKMRKSFFARHVATTKKIESIDIVLERINLDLQQIKQ